jgi:hypothetical protein
MICGEKMVRITLRDTKGSFDVETFDDNVYEKIQENNPGIEMDELRVEGVADFDDEGFDDYLDDLIGDFVAENNDRMKYSASRVLKALDPIMYQNLKDEEEDYLLETARDELMEEAEEESEKNWVDNIFRNYF